MKPRTLKENFRAIVRANDLLSNHGWKHSKDWIFYKGGYYYDLSAADIGQHERIEREGIFRLP